MTLNLFAFIVSFLVTVCFSPLAISMIKKLKAKQTILHYVKEHSQKQGTPTMGGIIFILPCFVISLFFFKTDFALAIISLAVMLSFGLLGFLDDFIKIRYQQNLGLRAYQKIIGQVGISLVIAIFAYKTNLVGSTLFIPFGDGQVIDFGAWIIPFNVFVFLALVNSVNLIDGLDGLCGGVSMVNFISFAVVVMLIMPSLSGAVLTEFGNLSIICFVIAGCLLAYFLFNCFPAKIFMGDTGSLALGGLLCSIAVFTRTTLYIPLIGFMYVLTAVSDVIQVLHYKRTKKRIFLMAPLHHHFQMSGVNENRITIIYIVTTMLISIGTIALILFVGG